ncbi:MAG: filamentous hemagglutinin N-terminal domain-containing protein, partial [Candidatus Omnitrophica bacterium]|nr:filamentous hemagglutinin N-terminal domain-containing protein [Candidatus Omnitrophota bacterium]
MFTRKVSNWVVLFVMVCFVFSPQYGFALPQGQNVVRGEADFDVDGNTMNVNVSTDKLIAEYDSFSIANPETVNFYQPSASSVALNRVVGGNPSSILGTLTATGKIFLVNPNGVLFGANSVVDTAGFVASTLNISNDDFWKGNYTFSGLGGSVVNQGLITAPGGYVALLGSSIKNTGVIKAELGSVALASGEAMTVNLDPQGMVSVVVDEATTQNLDSAESAVENSGTISADGGRVILTAQALDGIFDRAVNNTGLLEANSLVSSKGEVLLIGTGENDLVSNTGTIDVSAAEAGADGGFVEISAPRVIVDGDIDVTSIDGEAGTLFIDPTNFYILSFNPPWWWFWNNENTDPDVQWPENMFGSSYMTESWMESFGGSIRIQALNDVYLKLGEGWSGSGWVEDVYATDHLLTLQGGSFTVEAGRHIDLGNDGIYMANGGDINFLTDMDFVSAIPLTDNGVGDIYLGNGAGLDSNGGNINLTGINVHLTSLVNATGGTGNGSVDVVAGNHLVFDPPLTGNLNAGADLTLTGIPGTESSAFSPSIQSAVDAIGTVGGDATINLGTATYNENVVIDKTLTLTSASDPVLDGTGIGGSGILIKAPDVTIDDLEIRNYDVGVRTYGGPSNFGDLSILNSDIHDNSQNGILIVYDTFDNVTIENTSLTDNKVGIGIANNANIASLDIIDSSISNSSNHGLYINGSTIASGLIDNSAFQNSTWQGIHIENSNLSDFTLEGGTTLDGNGFGLLVKNSTTTDLTLDGVVAQNNNTGVTIMGGTLDGLTVENSLFQSNAWEHIDLGLWGSPTSLSNVDIKDNVFNAGPWASIYIDSAASFSPGDIKINYNEFYGANTGIGNGTAVSVDGQKNYWGVAQGPNNPSNPHGSTSGAGFYGPVDFMPWYATPTTSPSTEYVEVYGSPVYALSDTIQAGIDAAVAADTVEVVTAGIYYENLNVNKELTLLGTQAGVDARTRTAGDANETIVDGSTAGNVITVSSDNVTIDGFELKNGTNGISGETSDSEIKNNIIHDNLNYVGSNGVGILLWGDNDNNTIDQNVIYNNDRQGIFVGYWDTSKISSGNTLSNNKIYDNGLYTQANGPDESEYGIQLWNADGNTISGNEIYGHNDWYFSQGIYLCAAYNNLVQNNNIHDNNFGIGIYDAGRGSIVTNTITGNDIADNAVGIRTYNNVLPTVTLNNFSGSTDYHVQAPSMVNGSNLYNIYNGNDNTYDEAGVITDATGTSVIEVPAGYKVIFSSIDDVMDNNPGDSNITLDLFHKGALTWGDIDTQGSNLVFTNEGDLTLDGGSIYTRGGNLEINVEEDPNLYIYIPIITGGGNANLSATGFIRHDYDGYVQTGGGSFTGIADSDNDGIGIYNILPLSADITTSGGVVTLSGSDINIDNAILAGDGNVYIYPSGMGRTIALASGVGYGLFRLSDGEVSNIGTTGTITVGDINSGTITVGGLVNQAGQNLALITGDAIVEQGSDLGTDIVASSLSMQAVNGIGSGNALETEISYLEANNTNSGNIEIDNTGDLTVVG